MDTSFGPRSSGVDGRRTRPGENWQHVTLAGRPRIEPLTGLRWFAAFAVFLSHNVPTTAPAPLRTFFGNGFSGVTIFFVLSGFILTMTYRAVLERPTAGGLWNYGLARFARVYPLYLLVLLYVIFSQTSSGTWDPEWPLHVLMLQAWHPFIGVAFGLNGPGWSVGVETFLYALFPILIFVLAPFLRRLRTVLIIIALTVLMMLAVWVTFEFTGWADLPFTDPASAHRWLYRSPLLRIGDFMLGIGMAALFATTRSSWRSHRIAAVAAVAVVAVMTAMMFLPGLLAYSASFDIAFAIPTALLLYCLAMSPSVGLGRALSWRPIVALGELSYAFYLIHVPLGVLLVGKVNVLGINAETARFCLGTLLLVLFAWGLHLGFEQPVRVALRRWFSVDSGPTLGNAQPDEVDDHEWSQQGERPESLSR